MLEKDFPESSTSSSLSQCGQAGFFFGKVKPIVAVKATAPALVPMLKKKISGFSGSQLTDACIIVPKLTDKILLWPGFLVCFESKKQKEIVEYYFHGTGKPCYKWSHSGLFPHAEKFTLRQLQLHITHVLTSLTFACDATYVKMQMLDMFYFNLKDEFSGSEDL